MEIPRTPKRCSRRVEHNTPIRSRFFTIYDTQKATESFKQICRVAKIAPSTGRDWLRKRGQLGSPAKRRTRKLATGHLGRPYTISEARLRSILSPEHPSHDLQYESIIDQGAIPLSAQSLQWNFAKRLQAQRYKRPITSEISDINKQRRIRYGKAHQSKTLRAFWRYVYFTDECHFNSLDLATKQHYELRQRGSKQRLQRLQETNHSKLNVTIHVAAGISYDHKGAFVFYNDPDEPSEPKAYKPRRPRHGKYQSQES
jgi:transposase